MKSKLKIVFVGIPDMAIVCLSNLLEQNFDIAAVVPPEKSNDAYFLFKNFVKSKNLNLVDFIESPNEKSYIEKTKSYGADIGVCCSYNIKLNKEFLSTTRLGYINCHPSLLPQYRGAMPYFHIINNAEKISGITLHFMDENFDTGDIIYQEKFEILPWETMGILFNRTTYMLSDALIKILKEIENGKMPDRIPQKKDIKATKAPRVGGNFQISWGCEIEKIERLIRASNPFFGVWTTFRNTNLKILKAHIKEKSNIDKKDFGRIDKADNKNFIICANGGKLSLDVFQLGTWGILTCDDFYNTFSPKDSEFLK